MQKVDERYKNALQLPTEWAGLGSSFRSDIMADPLQVDAILSPFFLGVQNSRIAKSTVLICLPD